MASTYYGSWGLGVLGSWGSTTWVADIHAGRVWNFWVDNTAISFASSYVMIDSVITERQGDTHRVHVTMRNPTSTPAGFHLQWTVVAP